MKTEWAPCVHLWCPAYWTHLFSRGFTTNNYTESLNRALKALLILRANLRVDSLWRIVMEEFTPHHVQKHLHANLRDTDESITFTSTKFPKEFGRRPQNVMKKLLIRQKKAESIPAKDIIEDPTTSGVYKFSKSKATLLSEFRFEMGNEKEKETPAGRSGTPRESCLQIK